LSCNEHSHKETYWDYLAKDCNIGPGSLDHMRYRYISRLAPQKAKFCRRGQCEIQIHVQGRQIDLENANYAGWGGRYESDGAFGGMERGGGLGVPGPIIPSPWTQIAKRVSLHLCVRSVSNRYIRICICTDTRPGIHGKSQSEEPQSKTRSLCQ